MLTHPITGYVNLEHLVKLLSVWLLYHRVTVFPFQLHILWGDTVRLWIFFSLTNQSFSLSIHRQLRRYYHCYWWQIIKHIFWSNIPVFGEWDLFQDCSFALWQRSSFSISLFLAQHAPGSFCSFSNPVLESSTFIRSSDSFQFNSVQFSCSVVSDSLRPHELQHARPPCPSPTSEVHPNPWPLRRWCHPTISSSVIPFSSCPQSFPASGSFQRSQLFTSGGQRIGISASTSVLPMNTQDWSPSERTGWISLQSKDSQESSPAPQFESINSWVLSLLYGPTLTSLHDYWKYHSFD